MENEMQFDAPPEVVFDFLSDDRNEARWEPPNVSKIEKTSPGPVGAGTTFVGLYAPRDYEMHVRILEYDRPHLVVRETTGQVLRIGIRLEFEQNDGGTRVAAKWEVQPRGWMRLLTPMLRRAFAKQLGQREAQIARGLANRSIAVGRTATTGLRPAAPRAIGAIGRP
jgi:carbon monoxide dehydrogenase subunit G